MSTMAERDAQAQRELALAARRAEDSEHHAQQRLLAQAGGLAEAAVQSVLRWEALYRHLATLTWSAEGAKLARAYMREQDDRLMAVPGVDE